MRKRTRERLRDFGADEKGRLTYLGEHVRYAGEVPRGRMLARLWALAALAALASVVPGLMPVQGLQGTPFVTLAYVAQVVALVSVVWALARLSAAGERVRVYVREETADALRPRAYAASALAAVAALLEAVALVVGAVAPSAPEGALLACEAVAAASLALLGRTASRISWEPDRPEASGRASHGGAGASRKRG